MSDTQGFEAYRPLMFSIAYRMLGSMTEAEDIVQEAYIRYQSAAPEQIWSHKAYLSTIVTRLCLNQLQSARSQRETYIGPWLPEPVLTPLDDTLDPAHQAERAESISIAFLTLLGDLTPVERAVFLLREVFDYDYAEIAEIVGKEEAACRQLFSRAKKHIVEHRPRFKPNPEAHRQMLGEFIQAVTTGDLDGLMQMLADDVTMWTDGGGKARGAATHPLRGRDAVARFVMGAARLGPQPAQPELSEVNGELALIVRAKNETVVVMTFSVEREHIHEVRIIGNPDKLHWVSPPPTEAGRPGDDPTQDECNQLLTDHRSLITFCKEIHHEADCVWFDRRHRQPGRRAGVGSGPCSDGGCAPTRSGHAEA